MAPSKRRRVIDKNQRTEELFKEAKGLNKSKNFNQEQFVSRKDAVKDWKLKEHDLAEIREETVYHKKRREGLFYPLNSVKKLADEKRASTNIDEKMIPESVISSQVSRKLIDLKSLRMKGVYGTREGHLGRSTYFYKKEVIETTFDSKAVELEDVLGVDYLPADSVPDDVKEYLPPPKLAIRGYGKGPFFRAKPCYFGSSVLDLEVMGVHFDSQLRISSRSQLLRFRAQLDSNSNEDHLMTDLTAEMEDQFVTEYTAGIENQLVNNHNDGEEDQMVTENNEGLEDVLVTEQTEWLDNLLVTENSEGLEDQLVTENSEGSEDQLVTEHTEGLEDHVEEHTTRLEDQFVTNNEMEDQLVPEHTTGMED